MSEVLVIRRAGPALRVAVLRRPGPRLRAIALRLLGEGWPVRRVSARLRLRRPFVERLRQAPAEPAALSTSRASWSALVARETRAVERGMAA